MLTELIFATNNANKVLEMKDLLNDSFQILSLKDAGITIDIPEPYDSLEANAQHKCQTIFALTGRACFAEDTGLEVEALGGRPGVRTARFAGEQATADENMKELLRQLEGQTQRAARFRTVLALQLGANQFHFFTGVCQGQILTKKIGSLGFGYDPIFKPDGSPCSFGEMTLAEKKAYSHRAKAFAQLKAFVDAELRATAGAAFSGGTETPNTLA